MLFSWHFEVQKWKFEQNSENLKIQDGGRLWRNLYDYCCYGNQLDITRFRLIKSTNEVCYMYQASCQWIVNGWIVSKVIGGGGPIDTPPPLKASCNYFFFEASRVKYQTLDIELLVILLALYSRCESYIL